jgi:hypothetical protein
VVGRKSGGVTFPMTNNEMYSWIMAALAIGVLMVITVLIIRMIAPSVTERAFKTASRGFVFLVGVFAFDIFLLLKFA